jgi:hypothetical protein
MEKFLATLITFVSGVGELLNFSTVMAPDKKKLLGPSYGFFYKIL